MKRAEKKTATRDALIHTALTLFARHGYETTTVAQITQAVGVAKGTFFNYFATKEDVLLQVGDSQYTWAVGQLDAIATGSGPLAPQVRALLIAMAGRLPFTPVLIRGMFQAALAGAENGAATSGAINAMRAALVPVFRLGQEQGEFTIRFTPQTLATLAVQTYFGVLLDWSDTDGEEPLRQRMTDSMDALFHGIATISPPA
ncbi:MAG TPA: TetR/AcrR family transcriptional regulator [Symbiobacteriaceae bacterium]